MGKFSRPNKASLRNPQHYEFINAFLTTLADSGLSAAKITAMVAQLSTAFSEEDRLYMIARASEIIAQRNEADRSRDDFYARLHAIIRAWAGSGDTTMDAAATLLKRDFDLYKVKTSAQVEVESGQLSNLITELLKTDRQAAIQTLGVGYLFTEMKAAHELVQSLRLEQGVEESEKVSGALAAARRECDRLYDEITYLIEAYTLTADDPAPYEAFIKRWNGTLKIYQDIIDRKQGSGSGSSSNGQSGQNNGSGSENGGGSDNGGTTPQPDDDAGFGGGGDNGGDNGGTTPTPDPDAGFGGGDNNQGGGDNNGGGGTTPTPDPDAGFGGN